MINILTYIGFFFAIIVGGLVLTYISCLLFKRYGDFTFLILKNANHKMKTSDKSFFEIFTEEKKSQILNSKNAINIKNIPKSYLNDERFLVSFLLEQPHNFLEIPSDYYQNKDFCLKVISKIRRSDLILISNKFSTDRDFVIKAIKDNGHYYEYISEPLKLDREISLLSLQKTPSNYELLPEQFKNDEEFIKSTIKCYPKYLKKLPECVRDNKEYVLYALKLVNEDNTYFGVNTTQAILELASDNIKKLCEDKDPIAAIEKAILNEKLTSDLKSNSPISNKVSKI